MEFSAGAYAAASLAIAAASGAASYQASSSSAKAQMAYQRNQQRAHNEAAQQNAQSAIKEQVEASAAERVAQMQDTQAAEEKIFDNKKDRLQAQGQAVASSMADGTAFDQLVRDYLRTEARIKDVTKQQLAMQNVQRDFTVSGYKDRAQGRIDAQQGFIPAPVNQPSWGLAALGIAKDATEIGYRAWSMNKK